MTEPAGEDTALRRDSVPPAETTPRTSYRASGAVNRARLAASILLLAPILAAFSTGLAWLSIKGAYLVVLVPLLAGAFLFPFIRRAVRWAHCRNSKAGFLFGGLLGAAMYIGQFHALLVLSAGWRALPRVDMLPTVVANSVESRQLFDNDKALGANAVVNWIVFGAELLACTLAAAGGGVFSSDQPYCERCGRWMKSAKVLLAPLSGHAVAVALHEGMLDDLPGLMPQKKASKVSHSCLEFDYCRHQGVPEGTFYLTVTEVSQNKGNTQTATLLDKVEITAQEADAIVSKCSDLAIE